jgi:hypothetical protein
MIAQKTGHSESRYRRSLSAVHSPPIHVTVTTGSKDCGENQRHRRILRVHKSRLPWMGRTCAVLGCYIVKTAFRKKAERADKPRGSGPLTNFKRPLTTWLFVSTFADVTVLHGRLRRQRVCLGLSPSPTSLNDIPLPKREVLRRETHCRCTGRRGPVLVQILPGVQPTMTQNRNALILSFRNH